MTNRRPEQSVPSHAQPLRRHPHWAEPFYWWGPVWVSPERRTLPWLIKQKMLTPHAAALLLTMLRARRSLVVISEQGAAGKSTLLSALLDRLPPPPARIYLRGAYEPFDFVGQTEPGSSVILINELSPHLPIYLWGPPVKRALELGVGGYQLMATSHGRSVEDWIASLCRAPLRLPLDLILAFDLAVLITTNMTEAGIERQVQSITGLLPGSTPGSIRPVPLQRQAGTPLDGEALTAFLHAHNLDRATIREKIAAAAERLTAEAGDEGNNRASPNG